MNSRPGGTTLSSTSSTTRPTSAPVQSWLRPACSSAWKPTAPTSSTSLPAKSTRSGSGLPAKALRWQAGAAHEPSDGCQHPQPAQSANEAGDERVLPKEAEAGENQVPIVVSAFATAGGDQRQQLPAGVGHIGGGVEEVLEEKEGGEGGAGGVALEEEIDAERQRRQQLQQRPAPDTEPVAQPAEEQVPGLVDDEVDVVNQQEAITVGERVQQEQGVEHQPRRQRRSRHRLPVFFQRGQNLRPHVFSQR